MKRLVRKLKRTNKVLRYIYYVISIGYLVTYGLFVRSLLRLTGIETALRIILICFFLLWILLYIFWNLLNLIQKKIKGFVISSFISILFVLIFIGGSYLINTIYGNIDNIMERGEVTYTSYLVKLKDKEFTDESIIGRIENDGDLEGYKLANKLIEKEKITNEISSYDDYLVMVEALYDEEVDAIFLPGNYETRFANIEGYEDISDKTEIIYEYEEKMENQDLIITSNKDFSEPLTFLIIGVDSTVNGLNSNSAFNGDTLMLASINPKTLDVILVSIPRDTYVPIVCNNNKYSKINSAAAYGTNCVISTVESFLDVKVDYYLKINFKGVVELVDALGGVEVDVEAPDFDYSTEKAGLMCEQNSDRYFGNSLVCVKPGLQVLDGEEALAYARNRHQYLGSDLDRIVHQQQVVEALAKKAMNLKSLADFQDILSAISNNMATNMATDKILSGYNLMKTMALNALKGEEFIHINKAYLETYSLPVYLPNGTYTSAQGYFEDSLEDIQKNIKIILELEEEELIKTFNFSVNEEFIYTAAGKGLRSDKPLSLMPNLIGSAVSKAEEFCNENGIELIIEYVNPGDSHYNPEVVAGLIADQDVSIGSLLNDVSTLTIFINNVSSGESNEDNTTDENDNNNEVTEDLENETSEDDTNIDNFIDPTIEDFLN